MCDALSGIVYQLFDEVKKLKDKVSELENEVVDLKDSMEVLENDAYGWFMVNRIDKVEVSE